MNIFEKLFCRRVFADTADMRADLRIVEENYPYLGSSFVRDFLGGDLRDINDVYRFVLMESLEHVTPREWSKMSTEAVMTLVSFLSGFRDGGVIGEFGEYKLRRMKTERRAQVSSLPKLS